MKTINSEIAAPQDFDQWMKDQGRPKLPSELGEGEEVVYRNGSIFHQYYFIDGTLWCVEGDDPENMDPNDAYEVAPADADADVRTMQVAAPQDFDQWMKNQGKPANPGWKRVVIEGEPALQHGDFLIIQKRNGPRYGWAYGIDSLDDWTYAYQPASAHHDIRDWTQGEGLPVPTGDDFTHVGL